MKPYIAPGKVLPALYVSEDTAIGVVTLNQLEHFGIKSPLEMAKTNMSRTEMSDKPFKELREILQRQWDKGRVARAELYSTYIERVIDGDVEGATPPVTIYVDSPGEYDQSTGQMVFPYTSASIAIDGETQTQARHFLRERRRETGDAMFPVLILHNCSVEKAMQVLHDFNHFAKPIPESKLGMRNKAGGISTTVNEALDLVPNIVLNPRGSSGTKKYPASFQQAMVFVTGYAMGGQALFKAASTWFNALNTPGAPSVGGGCDSALADMFRLTEANKHLRSMPPYLWQVAGVLASEGHQVIELDWDAGVAAYRTVTPDGQGGNRGKTSERLHMIHQALRGRKVVAAPTRKRAAAARV